MDLIDGSEFASLTPPLKLKDELRLRQYVEDKLKDSEVIDDVFRIGREDDRFTMIMAAVRQRLTEAKRVQGKKRTRPRQNNTDGQSVSGISGLRTLVFRFDNDISVAEYGLCLLRDLVHDNTIRARNNMISEGDLDYAKFLERVRVTVALKPGHYKVTYRIDDGPMLISDETSWKAAIRTSDPGACVFYLESVPGRQSTRSKRQRLEETQCQLIISPPHGQPSQNKGTNSTGSGNERCDFEQHQSKSPRLTRNTNSFSVEIMNTPDRNVRSSQLAKLKESEYECSDEPYDAMSDTGNSDDATLKVPKEEVTDTW
ncbi:hypothetical protein Plec18170_008598 [Paecilomyces lecythidis]